MSRLADMLESGRAPGVAAGSKDPTHAEMAVPRALKQLEQTQGADSIVRGMGWKPTKRNIEAVKKCWNI